MTGFTTTIPPPRDNSNCSRTTGTKNFRPNISQTHSTYYGPTKGWHVREHVRPQHEGSRGGNNQGEGEQMCFYNPPPVPFRLPIVSQEELERKELKLKHKLSFEVWLKEKQRQQLEAKMLTECVQQEKQRLESEEHESEQNAFENWLIRKKTQLQQDKKARMLIKKKQTGHMTEDEKKRHELLERQNREKALREYRESLRERARKQKQLQEQKQKNQQLQEKNEYDREQERQQQFAKWLERKNKEKKTMEVETKREEQLRNQKKVEEHRATWKKKDIVLAYSITPSSILKGKTEY